MPLISSLNTQSRPADSAVAFSDGEAIDWGRWTSDVLALATHLDSTDGHRWALYCDDGYAFSVGLFGLWLGGRTPVLPPNNTTGTVEIMKAHVDGWLGDLPGAQPCLGHEKADPITEAATFTDVSSELILFTSGSTGSAKQVHKSVHQLDSELETLAGIWEPLKRSTTFLATVSHQHIYGLLFKILMPLTTGRAFEASLLQSPSSVTRSARRHEAAAWISSPAQLKRLDPEVVGAGAPPQLRCVVSSGGLLVKPIADVISAWLGQPAIEAYGSTESGGVAYREQRPEAADTPWRPMPGVAVEVADDGGLLVRSPYADGDNWLAMGDAVELFSDGTFALKGRIDRIAKIEDKRLSLEELEARLRDLPRVDDARALVIPGARETLAAVVVLSTEGISALRDHGKAHLTKGLRNALSIHFERVTVPRRWRFVAQLPTNEQGKIVHRELVALFDEDTRTLLPIVEQSERVDDTTVELALLIPDDLAYFEGHFPGEPILPGVVQIYWARHFGKTLLGFSGVATQMKKVKFKRVIQPGERIQLKLVYHERNKELSYRYRTQLEECSSGVLRGP